MSVQANIIAINQEIDLANGGSLRNYVTLRLPSGLELRALVDDDGVANIMQSFVTDGGAMAPAERIPAPPPMERVGGASAPTLQYDDASGADIFGGDLTQPEQEPAPAPPVQQAQPQQQPRRAPRVEKDDMGYPIVPRVPATVVIAPNPNADEDGVGQI